MKFSNRHGLQLAASIMVLLIVSVVLLVLATTFTYQVFCAAEELERDVDSQSQARIERLMAGSGIVAVADNTKDAKVVGSALCGSSRTRSATFSLGIKNTDASGASTFSVEITKVQPVPDSSPAEVQYFEKGSTFNIDALDTHTMTILVALPNDAPSEQHIYDISVSKGAQNYGAQRIYLNVE